MAVLRQLVFKVVLLLITLRWTDSIKWFNSYAGPYRIVLDRIYNCELGYQGYDGAVHYQMRISHFNPMKRSDPQIFNGNVTLKTAVTDRNWARIVFASRSNNGNYKDNNWIFQFPDKSCSNLRTNLPQYFKMIYNMDPNAKTPCIIHPGVYTVDNKQIDMKPPNIPVFVYGSYHSTHTSGYKNKTHECMRFEGRVIPM